MGVGAGCGVSCVCWEWIGTVGKEAIGDGMTWGLRRLGIYLVINLSISTCHVIVWSQQQSSKIVP